MTDETTPTSDEVEAHGWGGTAENTLEDLTENTLEAQDDETPDVEAHGFNTNTMENVAENTME